MTATPICQSGSLTQAAVCSLLAAICMLRLLPECQILPVPDRIPYLRLQQRVIRLQHGKCPLITGFTTFPALI